MNYKEYLTFKCEIDQTDEYTQFIVHKYDLNLEEVTEMRIPLIDFDELSQFEWNIGLICGESGSGKSTVLLNQFGEPLQPVYDNTKPVISQFPKIEPEELTNILESVGLSSVPVWLRKPNKLSVGEKARLDLCWQIINKPCDKVIIIDEFTSVLNREVAKSLAFCLQRYVREKNLKVVLSSCHFDMLDFLQPDWIFNLNKRKGDKVELERLVYLNKYENYPNINEENVLSQKMEI